MRHIVTFLIGLSAALTAPPQPPRPALEARFIGNMAFAITDGSVTLMTDFPYRSGYSVYMTYPPGDIQSNTPSTLSLITHRHGDHWEPALFNRTTWKVAGPADVTAAIAADRIVPLGPHTAFGPIAIERIETPHANIGHYSYIVTWHGRRLYFSGDTASTDSLAAAKRLDAAFVSPWIYQSMIKKGIRIDAKRVVIYHHQTGERVPGCNTGCSVPRQGSTIRLE
jgi:L-ascorbate metabolism protein UlaG (beta-lactamase superfamily)